MGITKNGAMTMIRMMPCPNIGRSSKSAKQMPPSVVIVSTPPTRISVFHIAALKLGSVKNQ